MEIKCYVKGCTNKKPIPWYTYAWMCVMTRSLHPYVCPEHYNLFD